MKFYNIQKKYALKITALTALFLAFGALQSTSMAQDHFMPASTTLDIPVMSAPEGTNAASLNSITHPPLRLTPDKSTIIELDGTAGSIIIGNPAHLNILADSGNRLIAVPRAQGASFFTVMDRTGNILMQRHVIVGSAPDNYMRIRRVCSGNARDCQPTSTYYCPDMCHEIQDQGESSRGASQEAQGEMDLSITSLRAGGSSRSSSTLPAANDVNE
ncbi:MAG: pilus assembly protein N-terminal domain-containing protein [Alphaproteobacteria bacterium]